MIGATLTFAMGSKLLDGEGAPETKQAGEQAKPQGGEQAGRREQRTKNFEEAQSSSEADGAIPNEQTSLLPSFVVRGEEAAGRFSAKKGRECWSYLPRWAQSSL